MPTLKNIISLNFTDFEPMPIIFKIEKLENKLEELHFLKDFFKPSQFILPFLCVAFSFDTFEIVSIH